MQHHRRRASPYVANALLFSLSLLALIAPTSVGPVWSSAQPCPDIPSLKEKFPPGEPAQATPQDLSCLDDLMRYTVYWVGAKPGFKFEVARSFSAREIYIRYLPDDTPIGSPKARFLTVGSYKVAHAIDHLRKLLKAHRRSWHRSLRHGGFAVSPSNHKRSTYFAYPHSNVEVEVFSPSVKHSRWVVTSGKAVPIP
jgi:hypothetical protein